MRRPKRRTQRHASVRLRIRNTTHHGGTERMISNRTACCKVWREACMLSPIVGGSTDCPRTQTTPNPSNSTPLRHLPPPLPLPVWSVGTIDFSGYVDGYYSYNANRRPGLSLRSDQPAVQLQRPDDQFNLEAAKLTLNHDPDPIGAHVDLIFGRTNAFLHPVGDSIPIGELHRAGIHQHQAGQGQGLRAGLRPVRHLGRPGSHRDDE